MSEIFVDFENHGKKRPATHVNGDRGVKALRSQLPSEWVIRECSSDYGIDLEVELFSTKTNRALGERVLVQVKGTVSPVVKNIAVEDSEDRYSFDVVQYQIDTDLLSNVEQMGSASPVLLAVVDVVKNDVYLVCLNDYLAKVIVPENPVYRDQGKVTINIPVRNTQEMGVTRFFEWYAKRAKFYAFFSKVTWQKSELEYALDHEKVEKALRFAQELGRHDVWSAETYWGAISAYHEELNYFCQHQRSMISDQLLQGELARGIDVDEPVFEGTYVEGVVSCRFLTQIQGIHDLWNRLDSLSHVFEDTVREWFLPTAYSSVLAGMSPSDNQDGEKAKRSMADIATVVGGNLASSSRSGS